METICLCITSRISAIPPECEIVDVPTLSMDAARDVFYSIYKKREAYNLISPILEQLDFHPLSITLLATVARRNRWAMGRLTRQWEIRQMSVPQTERNRNLAVTIELSLASPLFQDLGPDARALLEVVAFFPQGVDEKKLDWLFPTIPNRTDIFDKFCTLSLVYRSDRFIMMLAPLRDYFYPEYPGASPLLRATKRLYFTWLSFDVNLDKPNFQEMRWITSEGVNVEHLLDVFTTIDKNSAVVWEPPATVWEAFIGFMDYLFWYKKPLVILKPKIQGLPDGCKTECSFMLSRLSGSVGNWVEQKRLLVRVLEYWRRWRNCSWQVAPILVVLSEINGVMGLYNEGIQQAKEALEGYEEPSNIEEHTEQRAGCLTRLASLLCSDGQLDAAEEAAFRAIDLLPEKGKGFLVCQSHRALGDIFRSRGEIEKAIHHFEVALGIASSGNWHDQLFWVHLNLMGLSLGEGRLNDARAHLEHAKLHTFNSTYHLGGVTEARAVIWYKQHRLEEASTEALRAADIYNGLGAAKSAEDCRKLLRDVKKKLNIPVVSGQPSFNCELL